MRTLFFAVLIWLARAPSVLACAIPLEGQVVQGGLLTGQVVPGTPVSVMGKPVRVSAEGLFLVAFSRDATEPVELKSGLVNCTLQPQKRTYKISRIDGLPPQKVTPRAPEDLARIRADNAAIREVRRLDTAATDFVGGFQWPVTGRLSGTFGAQRILNGKPRQYHNGVDVAAPKGTPIAAAASGRVVLVHQDMFFAGKTVMLDHGHGLTSIYIHMSEITVKEGQRVKTGGTIGRVGMTGRATGPHLHWGVTLFGTHVDPQLLAGPMKAK